MPNKHDIAVTVISVARRASEIRCCEIFAANHKKKPATSIVEVIPSRSTIC